MKISIILPAHNEEGNISKMVEGLFERYDTEILEIIIVNDASEDETAKIAEKLKQRYKKLKLINRQPPCGVGRALKDGFSSINDETEWVLSMDSDFITNLDDVGIMLQKAKEGHDGVIGSRYIKNGKLDGYPFLKKLSNRTYHFLVKTLLGVKANDLTNNFKLYKKEIIQNIVWKSDDFAINAETGIMPLIKGYDIVEIPTTWTQRSSGKSSFKVFRLAPSYLKVLFNVLKKN